VVATLEAAQPDAFLLQAAEEAPAVSRRRRTGGMPLAAETLRQTYRTFRRKRSQLRRGSREGGRQRRGAGTPPARTWPRQLQWVLKLGVGARLKMEQSKSCLEREMLPMFFDQEKRREGRRRARETASNPRVQRTALRHR